MACGSCCCTEHEVKVDNAIGKDNPGVSICLYTDENFLKASEIEEAEELSAFPPFTVTEDKQQKAPPLDGTWIDSSSGLSHYHLIDGATMRWADNSTTLLKRDPPTSDRFDMDYKGQICSAKLSADGLKLEWTDGDVWRRAGLDGCWKEGLSVLVHVIEGSKINTRNSKLESKPQNLTLIDSSTFEMEIENQRHKAVLDPTGQKLVWDDGDVWRRVMVPETRSEWKLQN
eukprot:CAMPEP_0169106128 /NCGR_PEP_ID=MMETSP1015-20121227/24170_1 /TAXON_ID=342587 /ORGANISM="Karlodinium micrum, Strain CCMP2283" /LENGTH=228 /DNA_ID=CAMNT_0009167545 /DNA_START=69 /DNA_END=755 /DNA_ORIENTATION=+